MTEIAKEYADALFALALEASSAAPFADALTTVQQLFSENPAYVDLLASPAIPKANRCAMIQEAFGELPREVTACIRLLCEDGNIRHFSAVYEHFMDAYNQMQRVAQATITSATPLSDAEKAQLVTQISLRTGRTVQAEYTVDPSILGGVRMEIDGVIIDGSIKHRLSELKEVMNT